jgi:hypothetical protein
MRLLSDEDFNGEITRGLLRRRPDLDLVRVQDVGLLGHDDPSVREWAAQEGRILLTHDRATIPDFAYERINAGNAMPGCSSSVIVTRWGKRSRRFSCWSCAATPRNGRGSCAASRYDSPGEIVGTRLISPRPMSVGLITRRFGRRAEPGLPSTKVPTALSVRRAWTASASANRRPARSSSRIGQRRDSRSQRPLSSLDGGGVESIRGSSGAMRPIGRGGSR